MLETQRPESTQERAAAYLGGLPLEERRLNGQVYTPEHLVDFILDETGYTPAASIEHQPLLDPACGAGVFLERAMLRLAARLVILGADLRTPAGHTQLLEAVSRNLHGVDLDHQACVLARAAVRSAILRVSPGVVPERYFHENIVEADFLTSRTIEEISPLQAGALAFIVGNPPYVSATRIDATYKEELRSRFTTATGRLDLYTVFIERALSLLKPGGRLALITPDKFLVSQTARPLRSFILKESAVRTIAQFRSHKIFDDAATVPCVTVLERRGLPGEIRVLTCGDDPTSSGQVDIVSRSSVLQSSLSGAAWHMVEPALRELSLRLQGRHPTLASRTVRISAGPATGRDGVYVVPPEVAREIEPGLLRPAARGRDLSAYKIDDSGLQILVPYTFDAFGSPSLIDLRAFPGARRYLEQHKADLESRHCVKVWGKAWHDLHDQILVDLARQTKILVPDVASTNRFAVDHGKYFPLHSAYYLIPKADIDPYYLVAVLNSRIAEFLVRLLAPVVKDGFSRYRQQFLAMLPVPDASPAQTAAIITAARAGDGALADRLVTALFRPTDKDLRLIEKLLAERAGGPVRASTAL